MSLNSCQSFMQSALNTLLNWIRYLSAALAKRVNSTSRRKNFPFTLCLWKGFRTHVNYVLICFLDPLTPAFWEFFRTDWLIFYMQIKVEEKGLLLSHWYEKYFRWSFAVLTGGLAKNYFRLVATQKKRIGEQLNYF